MDILDKLLKQRQGFDGANDIHKANIITEAFYEITNLREKLQAKSSQQLHSVDNLAEALKWALNCLDTSDWEDDIHMSVHCAKLAWSHNVLRLALINVTPQKTPNV